MNVKGHAARAAFALGASLAAVSAAAIDVELVKDTDTSLSAQSSLPRDFRRVGGEVYFTATRADVGMELFAVGAAPGSARLVADLAPGGASSYARLLGTLPGGLLVAAAVGNTDADWYAHSIQIALVSPDGSERRVLTALAPWYGGSMNLQRFEPFHSSAARVWFRDSVDGSLWASDGSTGATGRVFATTPNTLRAECAVNDRLLFAHYAGGSRQLYASDGTAGGTAVIAGFASGTGPYAVFAYAGRCYFLESAHVAVGYDHALAQRRHRRWHGRDCEDALGRARHPGRRHSRRDRQQRHRGAAAARRRDRTVLAERHAQPVRPRGIDRLAPRAWRARYGRRRLPRARD